MTEKTKIPAVDSYVIGYDSKSQLLILTFYGKDGETIAGMLLSVDEALTISKQIGDTCDTILGT